MEGEQNNINANGVTGSSVSPIIGAVVILAIIVLGGLYFWSQRDAVTLDEKSGQSIEAITTQSQSDEAASIEADLNSTNVDNVDAELNTY